MGEHIPLMVELDTVAQMMSDAEEFGECVVYLQEHEEYVQMTAIDPTEIKELRSPYTSKLMGFVQKAKGLPPVFFSTKEIMKLKLVG